MTELFTTLFEDIQQDVKKNIDASKSQTLPDSSKPVDLQGSGTIKVPFHLDGNGNYHYEIEKYGAGVTVHFTAWITKPDAVYSITIKSSDGGGGHWDGVHINQKLKCEIKTSFWHNTKITVDIHANVTNVDGEAIIEYSY